MERIVSRSIQREYSLVRLWIVVSFLSFDDTGGENILSFGKERIISRRFFYDTGGENILSFGTERIISRRSTTPVEKLSLLRYGENNLSFVSRL